MPLAGPIILYKEVALGSPNKIFTMWCLEVGQCAQAAKAVPRMRLEGPEEPLVWSIAMSRRRRPFVSETHPAEGPEVHAASTCSRDPSKA